MTDAAVRVDGISYAYGDLLAVDDISFEVAPGEIFGFLGPNGAGKSTTIRMLTGLAVPKAGHISVLGMDITRHRVEVQARVGVSFEEKNLYLNMSGRENLDFFARLFGIKAFDAMPLLEKVDLADRANDRVSAYSRGMRQRLMVARSLVNTPDVLFLDEPTSGLDPVSSRAIRGVVRQEAARGAAVILTTHDMHEADELSDRVAFINEGRIAALDTPENLKLAHGRRSVRVRVREDGQVRDETVALNAADAGEKLKAAVGADGLMTIHTEEASLEAIFIQVTGRALEE